MKSLFSLQGMVSIRVQLVFFITVLIFIIICTLTAFSSWNSIDMLQKRTENELSQTLQQSAEKLMSFVELRQTNLDLWGAQPIIDVFFSSPDLAKLSVPGIRTFFSRIRENQSELIGILLTDHGEINYDDSNMLKGVEDLDGNGELRQFLEKPEPTCFVTNMPIASEDTQTVLFIKRPFVKNRRPVPGKYLIALIRIEELQRQLFKGVRIGDNGFVTLIAEREYQPIWVPNLERASVEEQEFREISRHWRKWSDISPSFRSLVLKVQQIPDYPLAVVGVTSNRDIFQMVYTLIQIPVVAGFLVLLLGIGATLALSKKITRPLIELVGDVRQLEFDKLEEFQIAGKGRYYKEIRVLYEAFAAMVQKLIVSRKELQLKNEDLGQMEQSQRIQKNYLHTTLSSIGEGIITTDKEGIITFMNLVAEQILGCSLEEMIDNPLKSVFHIINEETRTVIENPVDQVIQSGEISRMAKPVMLVLKNGMKIPLDYIGAPIRDEEENLYGVVLVFRDVTDRRNTERKMQESEERFRVLFESNPTSIWLEDFSAIKNLFDELRQTGVRDFKAYLDAYPETVAQCVESVKVVNLNLATLALHEAETKEQLLAGLGKTFTPESYAVFQEELLELWKGKTRITKAAVIKSLKGNLRQVTINCQIVPGYEESFARVLVTITDITEQQNMEEQLHQAQKMETIGNLAGGVAHDFNNMLSVIIGYTELGLTKIDSEHPLQENLREIQNAAKRSAEITNQLLAFARKQTISPMVLDMNKTIEDMLTMLRRLLGENLDLFCYPMEGVWLIHVDPGQINQILVNLCVNARDAIADVGKITIETAMKTFDEAYCAEHPDFIPGDFVMLAVSDNGSGMARETMDKVFDPFFTTKKIGRGTGMGLATVYGIVKQNRGFINVYSELGKGTTFRIYFPRHSGDSVGFPARHFDDIPPGGGELVLVVEDETSTLKLIDNMLSSLGYRVLPANTPDLALHMAEMHGDSIALLLTDVIMPEMNGRDLAGQLQALNPNMNCLFMSGYTANVIADQGILDQGVHFVQKPFSKSELAVKVRTTLDAVRPVSPDLNQCH